MKTKHLFTIAITLLFLCCSGNDSIEEESISDDISSENADNTTDLVGTLKSKIVGTWIDLEEESSSSGWKDSYKIYKFNEDGSLEIGRTFNYENYDLYDLEHSIGNKTKEVKFFFKTTWSISNDIVIDVENYGFNNEKESFFSVFENDDVSTLKLDAKFNRFELTKIDDIKPYGEISILYNYEFSTSDLNGIWIYDHTYAYGIQNGNVYSYFNFNKNSPEEGLTGEYAYERGVFREYYLRTKNSLNLSEDYDNSPTGVTNGILFYYTVNNPIFGKEGSGNYLGKIVDFGIDSESNLNYLRIVNYGRHFDYDEIVRTITFIKNTN